MMIGMKMGWVPDTCIKIFRIFGYEYKYFFVGTNMDITRILNSQIRVGYKITIAL
jgi:hypothetical protein